LLTTLACQKAAAPIAPAAPPPEGRPSPAPAGLPVWIDADPSVGVPGRDVDDGLALLQALHSPELAIRGVSLVFGNADLPDVDTAGRGLLARWAPELPVHTGAEAAGQHDTPAVDALEAALELEPLTLLVLGPATNIAGLLTRRPDLAPRIQEVILVAGRRPGSRFTTGEVNPKGHRDLNFESDPDAFGVLLAADIPLVLAPFEISSKVWLRSSFLDTLVEHPDAALLVEPARLWLQKWVDHYAVDGFNPFDTLAVAWLLRRELLTCETRHAEIVQGPDDRILDIPRDARPLKPFLHVRDPAEVSAPRAVTYCHDVATDRFLDDLLARLIRAN
jgi:pyrimidine-specific ribonucleoside hydrolase